MDVRQESKQLHRVLLERNASKTRITQTVDVVTVSEASAERLLDVPSPKLKHLLTDLSHYSRCIFPGTPNWFKIQKDLPFDDSEWSPPFTENSCESLHFMRAILFILYLVVFSSFAASAFTDFVVIRELVNVNAFKNNATGRSLVALGIISVGWMCSNLLYFANLVDLDKLEYWYSSRPVIYTYWTLPLGFLVDFEIGITWIDLYDRTNKMSKNSSQAVKILRIVTRLLSAVVIIIFFWLTGLGTQWGMIGTLIIPPVIGGIYVFVGSKLIVKTLCPDRKDTANPNWKVTEAIR